MNDSFNRYIQAFLAVFITFGFFGALAALLFLGGIKPDVKDILLVMLGALLASYKEITGYFFGSSSGSAKKDEVIAAASVANQLPTDGKGTPVVKVDDSTPVQVQEQKAPADFPRVDSHL